MNVRSWKNFRLHKITERLGLGGKAHELQSVDHDFQVALLLVVVGVDGGVHLGIGGCDMLWEIRRRTKNRQNITYNRATAEWSTEDREHHDERLVFLGNGEPRLEFKGEEEIFYVGHPRVLHELNQQLVLLLESGRVVLPALGNSVLLTLNQLRSAFAKILQRNK